MTPIQRSLAQLKADGYLCAIVEKWNPHARIRQDLWGFADILAIREGEVLAVQVTSRGNVSARVIKITEHENLPIVRKAGIRIEVHGWGKLKSGMTCKVVDLS